MAQQVKDSGVVNCGGLGHCCRVDSITVLGTSTCCGSRAKKKKKRHVGSSDISSGSLFEE